jgi:phosphatidylglycerophosphate synthase
LPNLITSLRFLMTLGLLTAYEGRSGVTLGLVAIATLVMDAIDGWLARRTGQNSAFGTHFDVEVDSVLVIALAMLLHARGIAGPWVLVAGLWHYLYLFAPVVLPAPEAPPPRTRVGRLVYVLMISSFVLALMTPPALGELLAAVGTLAVSTSFAFSFWQRYQPRQAAPAE